MGCYTDTLEGAGRSSFGLWASLVAAYLAVLLVEEVLLAAPVLPHLHAVAAFGVVEEFAPCA